MNNRSFVHMILVHPSLANYDQCIFYQTNPSILPLVLNSFNTKMFSLLKNVQIVNWGNNFGYIFTTVKVEISSVTFLACISYSQGITYVSFRNIFSYIYVIFFSYYHETYSTRLSVARSPSLFKHLFYGIQILFSFIHMCTVTLLLLIN